MYFILFVEGIITVYLAFNLFKSYIISYYEAKDMVKLADNIRIQSNKKKSTFYKIPIYFKIVLFTMITIMILQVLVMPVILMRFNQNSSVVIQSLIYAIMYALERYIVTLLFLGRLYFTFYGTAFQVSNLTFTFFVILMIVAMACLGVSVIYNGTGIQIILATTYVIFDWATNISLIGLFIGRLKKLLDNNKQEIIFKKLINTFIFLYSLTFVSSAFVSVVATMVNINIPLSFDSLIFLYVFFGFDTIINAFCAYYSMGFVNKIYIKYCASCESICINKICRMKTSQTTEEPKT